MKLEIIDHLITECSLDKRVTDGMFNPMIQEHMNVLIDKMLAMGILYEDVKQFTNKIAEGKYPERQAYNKEGFLVTFPTPDYKSQALSSGDYFNYDPTSGKGGMHLVKKADPSTMTPTGDVQEPKPTVEPNSPTINEPTRPAQSQTSKDGTEQPPANNPIKTSPKITNQTAAPKVQPQKTTDNTQNQAPEKTVAVNSPTEPDQTNIQSKPEDIQKISKKEKTPVSYVTGEPDGEPLDLTNFSAYKDPSLEWAHNQKWEKRDNGNYYDNNGVLRAVIGIDGSAVPATEQDRASIRQWLDKKRQERLPGEKL